MVRRWSFSVSFIVTGLTVNEFPNVRRSYGKQLRAILHSCEKCGAINAAKEHIKMGYLKTALCTVLSMILTPSTVF